MLKCYQLCSIIPNNQTEIEEQEADYQRQLDEAQKVFDERPSR